MSKTRMCISCRVRKNKEELLRIVSKNKMPMIDVSQKENTRGMYICNNNECINRLLKSKDISKCVKIDVNKEELKELLKNLGE